MVVFEERGNRSTWRKPLGAEKKTNKLNPHLTPDLGIEPGPHWWEARTVQVVRKQFPLRPAAPKTIHRSQGDTETIIVVNFDTGRAIPHLHYVGLSRVTTIEGLHIIKNESKIAVGPDVQTAMETGIKFRLP